ncbi:TnpV protein [Enterocloster clostridioformis]|uniref:TnpV protein n=1 Tax=Enterocloster clostridioformis TaxID=1531 RepID=UPI001CE218A2|nr:TnpV protein [Enterocloster clostridioformis]MCA5577050.1 TnpV protein [Enterocloster clostridioformis]
MVELNYRKEKDGLLYPMLETGSQQAEGLETLGRYAKLAQEYLLEKDESRHSLLLRTGKLLELLKQIEAEAWELHDQIVEGYVRMKAAERNIKSADTMEMTRLRNEAAMITQETVMQEVICKPR